MSSLPSNTSSIEQLYENITSVLKNNLSLFQGLILTNVSIDKVLSPHKVWQYSFYTGTNKSNNKNHTAQLKISNAIILEHIQKNGDAQHNAKYDIEIDSLSISSFGAITITVRSLKETGISERELLRRKLEKFTKAHGYNTRTKKELPRLITSILALTSKFSNIHDDLHSNLNINKECVKVVNCVDSNDISQEISNNTAYDVIVLYRGGREDEAMNMFSSEGIIKAIDSSKVPVCAALGHDIDTPFIYAIADKTYSTPSAFSKAITVHNNATQKEYIDTLRAIANILAALNEAILNRHKNMLISVESVSQRLYEKVNANIDRVSKGSQSSAARLGDKIQHRVTAIDEDIESLVLYIYKEKIDNLTAIEIVIEHHMNSVYKNRVNHINILLQKTEHVGLRIEEIINNKEALYREGSKKQKTLYILIGAIIVLLGIIIWLVDPLL